MFSSAFRTLHNPSNPLVTLPKVRWQLCDNATMAVNVNAYASLRASNIHSTILVTSKSTNSHPALQRVEEVRTPPSLHACMHARARVCVWVGVCVCVWCVCVCGVCVYTPYNTQTHTHRARGRGRVRDCVCVCVCMCVHTHPTTHRDHTHTEPRGGEE